MTIGIPLIIVQVALATIAVYILHMITPDMMADFSCAGGLIMVATGLRICNIKPFPVANMLPGLLLVMPFPPSGPNCCLRTGIMFNRWRRPIRLWSCAVATLASRHTVLYRSGEIISMQEHVILLDEHGSPIGMEKYTAITITPRCISPSPPGFSIHMANVWSHRAGRWAKSLAGRLDQLRLRTSARGETLEQAMVCRCRYEVGSILSTSRRCRVSLSGNRSVRDCRKRNLPGLCRTNRYATGSIEEVMEYQWVNLMPSSARWRNPGHLVRGWCWKRTQTNNSAVCRQRQAIKPGTPGFFTS
jgi:hypothetical protein